MLVRTWNLFHGNTVPPQRRAFLDEMIRLATEDDPDVLCVQEVPAWALGRFTVGDIAARPLFGATLGRLLTAPNHGLFRSAFAGQGNAITVAPRLRVVAHHVSQLNRHGERRIVQAVRLDDGRRTFVVANTHCTSSDDEGVPDAELLRAAAFARSVAQPDEALVLAGDFNVRVDRSPALAELAGEFSQPGPGIDHVLVRGGDVVSLRVWPEERRRRADGTLLSDHAPVEVDVDLG